MAWNIVLLRLFLAAFFGALIGLERERKEWVAGLRTHMMVSVGARSYRSFSRLKKPVVVVQALLL